MVDSTTGTGSLLYMALFVGVLLIAASAVVPILRIRRPEQDYSELSSRIKAWWLMAALFFCVILARLEVSILFFAFLSFWSLKEFFTLLATRPTDHRAIVLAFLAIPIQYYWIAIGWYGMAIIFIPVYMFLIIPSRLVLATETAGFVASAAQIQWGLMGFVFGLSHLALIRAFPVLPGQGVDGRTLLLFLVFATQMSDVLQYVWGKSLGRRKVIPTVSPNKTWEGLLGGIASMVLLSLAVRFLTPFKAAETVWVSLLIGVCGFFGGAVMSAVKRDFGVKDFGEIIPGHGGMLDRVDSLCFAAPVFFHYLRYFYY